MKIPKRYGESRVDRCPFCNEQATAVNPQGVPVCRNHTKQELGVMRCVCGDILDIKQGKYGVFFSCMNCGTMNLRKALEINQPASPDAGYKVKGRSRGEREQKGCAAGCEKSSSRDATTETKSDEAEKIRKPVFFSQEEEYIRPDDPRYFD